MMKGEGVEDLAEISQTSSYLEA